MLLLPSFMVIFASVAGTCKDGERFGEPELLKIYTHEFHTLASHSSFVAGPPFQAEWTDICRPVSLEPDKYV